MYTASYDTAGNKVVEVKSPGGYEIHWHGGSPVSENTRTLGPGEVLSFWLVAVDGQLGVSTTVTYAGESEAERAENIRTAAEANGLRVGI